MSQKVKCECCNADAIEGLKTCGTYKCIMAYRDRTGVVVAKEISRKKPNGWKKMKEMKKQGIEYVEPVTESTWEMRK